jgi:hypothetical protein
LLEGSTVITEGEAVGVTTGLDEGECEWDGDGVSDEGDGVVGTWLGCSVGARVGWSVGVDDGAALGSLEGAPVGLDEGDELGAFDGSWLGASVGNCRKPRKH